MRLVTLSEKEVCITLLAVALLLTSAYICGKLMECIKAPRVVGEILGGMIFGGSCLAYFLPECMNMIFTGYPEEGKVLNIFYQLGLIFLMFSSGFNTQLEMNRKKSGVFTMLFIGATVLPMLAAIFFAPIFEGAFIGTNGSRVAYLLVFIIGVAITSIPVISKIFFDMGIMDTPFANMVLTVSTFQDLCLWIVLNVATRIATTGEVRIGDILLVVALTLGMFILVKIVTDHLHGYRMKMKATDFYTISFILLLFVAAVLNLFGINIMYSAFLVGYIVKAASRHDETAQSRMQAVADFSFSFFVPIYFALVGIQLNVIHHFSLGRFLLFFVIAFALEAIGTAVMLLFTKLTVKSIVNFAITMNARGGPGIVLATVAYSYEIISIEFFTVLILTTMLSSFIAGYWLRYQQKRDSKVFHELMRH